MTCGSDICDLAVQIEVAFQKIGYISDLDHIPKWPGSHLKRSDLCRSDCHEKIRYRSHRGKKIGIRSFQPAV